MLAKPAWKWINLAAFLCMVLVNCLAEMIPIGGYTTGEISALYPSPLTPAPVSFSIWAVIYLCLAAFMILQVINRSNDATQALGSWFLFSCIANITWLLLWHFQSMTLSMLCMALLLVTLIIIEKRLREKHWLIRAPFSLYYGWITVAAIANVSSWLASLGFTGFGLPSQLWLTVVLLAGGVILSVGVLVNRDVLYGLAGLWGYVGILIRQMSLNTGGNLYFWSQSAIVISGMTTLFVVICTAFDLQGAACTLLDRFRNDDSPRQKRRTNE